MADRDRTTSAMNVYPPRGEQGWTRIGQYDRPRRRSLWSRITRGHAEYPYTGDALSVELCAGREGDDAYVKVEPGNPIFAALVDVIEYAEANLPTKEDADAAG